MRQKASKKQIQNTKCCPKCGRVLPLLKFYPNKKWDQQIYRDLWCRDCVERECTSEKMLREYCEENCRVWKEGLYEAAVRLAQKKLAVDASYTSAPDTRKEDIAGRAVTRAFVSLMNMNNFYEWAEDKKSCAKEKPTIEFPEEEDEAKKMAYSKRWRGYFTPDQIEILEEIYDKYDQDFDLSNVSLQDYAIKVAKASFHADQIYDMMRRGLATGTEYKDALKIFDDLSKSSNFAACRRKPGETAGMGALGEIIVRIEGAGKLNVEGVHWEKDSVDAAIDDYRHIVEALGREGNL